MIKAKPIGANRGKARVATCSVLVEVGKLNEILPRFSHYLTLLGTEVTVQDWYYEEIEVADINEPDVKVLLAKGFVRKEQVKEKWRIVKTDRPRVRKVNLLDLYVPFTAESLAWACRNASVILRTTETIDEVRSNPAYDESARAKLAGSKMSSGDTYNSEALDQYNGASHSGTSPASKTLGSSTSFRQERPFVEIFTRFGMLPKSWLTHKPEDSGKMVPAIVTCGLDSSGNMETLSVRASRFGAEGPFEEAWFNKLPNRWYGEGVGERLIGLQIWHNEIVNMRRNNELVTQNRMFKYKKGAGVNPNDFRSRPGGGIGVKEMDDVMPLEVPDVSSSSFQEDATILQAAQRLAGVPQMPTRRLTEVQTSALAQEGAETKNEIAVALEDYLERVFNRHVIPLLKRFFPGDLEIPVELPESMLKMMDTLNGYEPFLSESIGRERSLLINDGTLYDGNFAIIADVETNAGGRNAKVQTLINIVTLATKLQNSGMNFSNAFRKICDMSGIVDERLFEDAQAPVPSGVKNASMPAVEQGGPAGGMMPAAVEAAPMPAMA